jgi:hypothetical protein
MLGEHQEYLEAVRKLSPLRRLAYWMQSRESIRLGRKAGQEAPWTDDPILARYRFCNVRRMDDRVSRWLLHNWYEPHYGHKNALLACALARLINLPESLIQVGYPVHWRPERIRKALYRIREAGKNGHGRVFNGAYIISAGGSSGSKIDSVIDRCLQPLVDDPPEIDTYSMENSWTALRRYKGFGSFMAGQVIADLRWASGGLWADKLCWAPLGPGSRRGMNRLHGRLLNQGLNQKTFTEELNKLITDLEQHLSRRMACGLEAIDYQNCLCEFDKYERTLWEGRRPKAVYKPYQGTCTVEM